MGFLAGMSHEPPGTPPMAPRVVTIPRRPAAPHLWRPFGGLSGAVEFETPTNYLEALIGAYDPRPARSAA